STAPQLKSKKSRRNVDGLSTPVLALATAPSRCVSGLQRCRSRREGHTEEPLHQQLLEDSWSYCTSLDSRGQRLRGGAYRNLQTKRQMSALKPLYREN